MTTRPAAPPPSDPEDADFEEMLAGMDRIIHDPELQQQLLDAGLLVRVPVPDPGADPGITSSNPDGTASWRPTAAPPPPDLMELEQRFIERIHPHSCVDVRPDNREHFRKRGERAWIEPCEALAGSLVKITAALLSDTEASRDE